MHPPPVHVVLKYIEIKLLCLIHPRQIKNTWSRAPVRKEVEQNLDLLSLEGNLDPLDGIIRQLHDPPVAARQSIVELELLRMIVLEDSMLAVAVGLGRLHVNLKRRLGIPGILRRGGNRLYVGRFLALELADHFVILDPARKLEFFVLEVLDHAGRLGHVVKNPLLAVAPPV